MRVLNSNEVTEVSGGNAVATVGGAVTGFFAAAAVVGTGGAVLGGAVLGAAIWNAGYYAYEWLQS